MVLIHEAIYVEMSEHSLVKYLPLRLARRVCNVHAQLLQRSFQQCGFYKLLRCQIGLFEPGITHLASQPLKRFKTFCKKNNNCHYIVSRMNDLLNFIQKVKKGAFSTIALVVTC